MALVLELYPITPADFEGELVYTLDSLPADGSEHKSKQPTTFTN